MNRPAAFRLFPRKIWQGLLHGCFALLCLRFSVSLIADTAGGVLPGLALFLGFALSSWRWPRATLIAFAAAVPWLNGLERTVLLPFPHPSVLGFSSIYLAWSLRGATTILAPRGPQTTAAEAVSAPQPLRRCKVVIDILITVVLASLAWQMVRYPDRVDLWGAIWHRPVLAFGDRCYFLTAAFWWLQGLFFARLLLHAFNPQSEPASSAQASQPTPAISLPAIFASYCAALTVFAGIQELWWLPEKFWNIFHTSPYEDIHSFGSIAIACLVFLLARWRPRPWRRATLGLVGAAILASLIVVSWSRATWLAGFIVIVLTVFLRISGRWRIVSILVSLGLLVAANLAAKTAAWQNKDNFYLARLGSLVRFENPAAKDFTRVNLYHKALRMIQDRPLVGHGIGSFYLNSVAYATAGDPHAQLPNFAHNMFLQFAVELGVPVVLLLAGLVGFMLLRGFRCSWTALSRPDHGLLALGLTLALSAYLLTQQTANALNIYPSNQFFFWFLGVGLLTWTNDPSVDKAAVSDWAA